MNVLETRTRQARDDGRRLLVPYVTGAITDDWIDILRAGEQAGADVFEIGLPFSDPTLDGPTIQQASDRALARGATVDGILAEVAALDTAVPLVVMTYANVVLRHGADAFCARLRDAGVAGLIVPDVPLDEADPLSSAAGRHGVDLVLLAAPCTDPARRARIAARSRGFVYAVSVMGTTGEQVDLPDSRDLVASLQQATDLPVLLGFGVSTPEHAAAAARYADGVIVASALMRRVVDGARPAEIGARLALMRAALDG